MFITMFILFVIFSLFNINNCAPIIYYSDIKSNIKMHQQFSFARPQESKVKSGKSSKFNANFSVKKAVIELQQTYWSEKCKPIHQYGCHNKSIYLQVIVLTEQICTNLLACSKSIKSSVDLVDVFMNNFVLGVKIKNGSMVGGFVFILIKYLSQGPNNLVFHLQHLRKIASQFKQNYQNSISSQLLLACQNLHILILPSLILQNFPHFKIQNVTLNALISLSRAIENSQQKNKNKIHMERESFLDPQQFFYHHSLKAAKISKLSKRNCFYKELLASYFKYVSSMKIVPTLDTCKLLIDAITIDQQNFNTNQSLNSNPHFKSAQSDIQLTGFLIRKCFVLISQNYKKVQFFIENDVFVQTVKKCLTTSPYNLDSKNITQIFQTLIEIKRIDLVATAENWMSLNLENSKIQNKSSNFMDSFKYLCSCLVFLQQVAIPEFIKSENKNRIEEIKVIEKLNSMKKSLQKNIHNLMLQGQQIILYICDQIISTLFTINSNIFLRCQQKDKKHYKIIQQWSVCSQIQNTIINNSEFRKIRGVFYLSYQHQNNSILIIRQYIRATSFQNADQYTYHRLPPGISFKSQKLDQLLDVFKNVDDFVKNQELIDKLFRYWDQLVNFGAIFLQNCANIYSLQKISELLKQLIKCQKMIGFANNILIRNNNKNEKIIGPSKINKIYGFYNLILVLQKINQNKISAESVDENPVHNSAKTANQLASTKSNLLQFNREKERIRKTLLSFAINYFFELVLTKLLPFLGDQYHDPSRAQHFAFEQIFAHLLSIIPQLYSDLTLQERISIYKLRKRLIDQVSQGTLNKCRYVYHRNFTFLLQQYYISSCKDNTASKTIKQDEKKQAKVNVINFLDSYAHLYRKKQCLRKSLSRRNSPITKLNKKKGKTYEDEQTVVKSFNKKQQCPSSIDYNQGYHDILYIDFMQWVTYYAENKGIADILAYVQEIMEEWLEGITIQQYLMKLFSQISKNINPTTLDLQLLIECTNKLLYLRSNKKSKSKTEITNSESNQISNLQMNIEFEVQQASFHIRQLNQILSAFNTFCREFFKYEEHISYFLQKKWFLWIKKQGGRLSGIRNFSRMNICLNNIIGVAVNIGHKYKTHLNRRIGEEINFTQLFCYVKLLICRQCHTVLEMYTRYSEMVFLGYVPLIQDKLSEIKEYLQGRKDEKVTIAEQNMIVMIKLFLGMIKIGQNNLPDSQIISSNSTLKQIFIITNLKHMHPHKYLLRSISSHIFNFRQTSQASILKYEQPLLPITYSILIQNEQFALNTKHQIKNMLQFSNSQIQHKILQFILISILQCLLLQGQLSQFRSILRLAAIYFMRARNLSGILLSLYCYFIRVKNTSLPQCGTHYANEPHRKSQTQTQSMPEKNSTQELLTQLDMLSISDSLSHILETIFVSGFDKRNYDKFCKIILANKRRTSMSFHVSFQSVIEGLARSLSLCGHAGAEVFLLLGDHACKVLECKKQSIMYRYYLELCEENGKKYNQNICLKRALDQDFMKIYKTAEQEKQSFRKLQTYLVQKTKSVIALSFYHALLIQNLLSNIKYKNDSQLFWDTEADDELMLDLCVLMLDHNYAYKRMIQQMHKISISLAELPTCDYLNQINEANAKYQQYLKEYLPSHSSKMSYLMSPNKLKYPLTIIYPFGPKVCILAVQHPLVTIQMDRYQFDEHINTIDNLILNNSRLLNDKNVDPKQWWKSRDRVNRSIGKIVNQIGIFLWDVCLNPHGNNGSQNEKKIWKLVYISIKACIKDYKKIKSIIESSGINTQSINVDEIILSVNSFLNQIPCEKNSINQQQNLLLLIHPHYSIFPYQQNSYLSRERAVYRIPSIEYILQQTRDGNDRNYKIFNISNTNYLVNSGNDLPDTEKNFYKIKNTFPLWKGIVGRKPTIHEFFNLFSSEAYLFMGHGAGNAHIREKQFYNNMINCLILLFGCSSASMTQEKSQFNGISYSHLINGAPGLLGCLWEVTDKDTDRVTQNLFKNLGKDAQNLSKLLSSSKRKCKHQYLNGGSIVVFGLPIYVYLD